MKSFFHIVFLAVVLVVNTQFYHLLQASRVLFETSQYKPAPTSKILDELHLLTTHNRTKGCQYPLRYYENRIVQKPDPERMIPRILHVSYRSRCLPQDLYMHLKRWEEQLPETSIFFHDDDAVHELIHRPDISTDFPWLESAMKCVFSKGAMTIDIWRILVLYKYGGIYTDIDNWPEDVFGETTIPGNFSAFFFSDTWLRPSQWFMAFEPNHPLLYLAVEEIMKQLFVLKDLEAPRLVFVTGPHVLRKAYVNFLSYENITLEEYRNSQGNVLAGNLTNNIFEPRNDYRGMSGKIVRKEPYPHGIITSKKNYSELVLYNGTMITRFDRIMKEARSEHWTTERNRGYKVALNDKTTCREVQRKWENARHLNKK